MTVRSRAAVLAIAGCVAATAFSARLHSTSVPMAEWSARAAAGYLDARMAWWLTWKNASRDHETSCVSCHTAVPYALARPALRGALSEREATPQEQRLLENVSKRVRLWREVEPFYPDQSNGLPKSSESRGTEAVMNALILSRRDAAHDVMADDTRQAFANLWPLQFRNGELKGTWAWLNFHYEPWEASGSPYFGAALAAIAVGSAPGGYASSSEIQPPLNLLRDYIRRGADTVHLFNRVMALWASGELPGLLAPVQQQAIVDAAFAAQRDDGGWSTAALGPWTRIDGTSLDARSDGYATGLVSLALQRAGQSRDDPRVRRGLDWLARHQDVATGMWVASSVNKSRDLATDVGKFMSDAATAYAVMALTQRP